VCKKIIHILYHYEKERSSVCNTLHENVSGLNCSNLYVIKKKNGIWLASNVRTLVSPLKQKTFKVNETVVLRKQIE